MERIVGRDIVPPNSFTTLVTRLYNVATEFLVELIEVLELRGFDRKLVSLECDLSTHDHQLRFEVTHHVRKEVISHFVELLAVRGLVVQCVLEFVAHRDRERVHSRHFLDRKILDLTRENVAGFGQLAVEAPVSHELASETLTDSTCRQIEQSVVISVLVLEKFANEDPRAGSSKRMTGRLSVVFVHVLLCEGQITNYVLVDALVDSPSLPRSEVGTHLQVNETIRKRLRHAIRNALVRVAVTSSDHDHVRGQLVLTNATVENQLISSSHHRGGSRVHFIKEQHHDRVLSSRLLVGQIDRGSPIHLARVLVEVGDTTNVSGFHLRHTQIDHQTTEFLSDLSDHLRLTDAGRTPEKDGTLLAKRFENGPARLNAGDSQIVRYGH